MSAYVVFEAKVSDAEKFADYAQQVPDLVSRFGGEYVVLRGETESLEGNWSDSRITILRWSDMAGARQFWESREFGELRKLREGAGDFRAVLLDGLH